MVLKAEECRDGFGLRYGWVQESVQWCVVFVSVSLSSLVLFGFIPQAGSIHPGFPHLGLDLCTTYPPWLSIPTFLELLAAESGLSLLACVCLSFAADMGLFVSSHQSPLAFAICYLLRVTSYLFPILFLWGHQHDLAPPRHLPCSCCRLCPPIF